MIKCHICYICVTGVFVHHRLHGFTQLDFNLLLSIFSGESLLFETNMSG